MLAYDHINETVYIFKVNLFFKYLSLFWKIAFYIDITVDIRFGKRVVRMANLLALLCVLALLRKLLK